MLEAGDVISVEVFQEPDLTARTMIDKDGMVTLMLLGQVKVGEKTPEAAAELIRKLYEADYLVNPRVAVNLVEPVKKRYTVMGQVQRPNTYDIPINTTVNLLEAIAAAGGFTRLAAPSKVTLQRMENGKPVILKFDAERMSKDKNAQPPVVQPDDIISVGERLL
jgi:protein involved in polysaccharide export with SLBB domain